MSTVESPMRNATIALGLALTLGLAGCSTTEEENVEFPTFAGKRVMYVADSDGDDASLFGDEVFMADTGSLTQTVTPMGDAGSPSYFDQPGLAGINGPLIVRVVT